ncbi:MAG TPA: hypothetical protein VIJ46_04640 [Rhabdochlamydiaceae bacterium]
MNLLPFVCAMLVIFGLLSTSLFRERLTLSNLKSSCQGILRAERTSRNYLEAKEYKKHPKEKSTGQKKEKPELKPNPPPPKAQKTDVLTYRDAQIFTTNTKLDLSPLFSKETPLLYETAVRYIRFLYSNASFYKEGLENQILDQIVAQGAAAKERTSFADLFPKDPAFAVIFYKMLKGTGSYDLDSGKGYPPLENYFQLAEGSGKPINIHFAPTRLIRSLFGEQIASGIFKEESASGSRISQTKLEDLLMKNNLNAQTFDPLLNYSSVKTVSQVVTISDEESGISVQTWEKTK